MAKVNGRWHATVRGSLRVFRDGDELGRYPNKTAGVLLVGLLSRLGEWSSRSEIADLLYPGKSSAASRAALRQCLLRLRTWLGEAAIELDLDRLRLSDRLWTTDLDRGEPAAGRASITPDLQHPWLDSLRSGQTRSRADPEPNELIERFHAVIKNTAAVDCDVARSLLIGGSLLVDSLKIDVAKSLLSATIPKDRRDPLACEYLELLATIQLRSGAISVATSTYLRAHRLALQAQDPVAVGRVHALVLFSILEAGNLATARDWYLSMPTGKGVAPSRLLINSAQSAFHWNANRCEEAIECVDRSKLSIKGTDRLHRLHFWRNYAVLCAEAGRTELSEEAEMCARELLVPGIDVLSVSILELARGTRLMAQDQAAEAKIVFDQLAKDLGERGWIFNKLYAEEAGAEALARCGELTQASQMWRAAKAKRTQMGGRLTPRLAARQARLQDLHVRV